MAGTRVTHSQTTAGTQSVLVTGVWEYVRVVNWGTVALQATAQHSGAAPTLAWNGDDQDIIPVGQSKLLMVTGAPYDQGDTGETNPGVTAYVIASGATAGSAFSVEGANG